MFFSFFTSANVVEFSVFTMLFPKGVQLQLDGWPWNGEGVLGAKGMCESTVFGCFPTKARFEC